MIYYKDGDYNVRSILCRRRKSLYDDNIYSFDIETTSCFIKKDGSIMMFDPEKDPVFYDNVERVGFMYIWQFSINESVYYGRTWEEFTEFLMALHHNIQGTMIIYVHNLSFEFQFLRNIIHDFTIFARKSRHVIVARSDQYNVEFRCSYMLTQSKLADLPSMYDLPVQKMSGDLDYNVFRNSKTILTDQELTYCEHDCLVVYYLIKKFKERYDHVCSIPLTQTGTLRRECQQMYRKNYKYHNRLKQQLPQKISDLSYMMKAFAGGYTHANHYYTGDIIRNVKSRDITSSYPTVMIAEKYPCSPFLPSSVTRFEDMQPDHAYILDITFNNIYTLKDNTYISYSKLTDRYHCRVDNGRVAAADMLRITITEVDLDIIKKCYKWESYTINECRRADLSYLDRNYILKILDLYNNKTKYKGLPDKKNEYMQSKQYINSLYGMMVTNLITDTVTFNDQEWDVKELTDTDAQKMLDKINRDPKTFLSQAWGVYVTAYARHNLWDMILQLDHDVLYCDTDSVKFIGDHDADFERYNIEITQKLTTACNFYNIDPALLSPADSKGIRHPLGVYDPDDSYKEFITLGAKKYCYKDQSGKIGITVAGVPKCGKQAIKTLTDFKEGLVFDYRTSGKQALTYNDVQKPFDAGGIMITDQYGINLMPTVYTMGISEEYGNYINDTLHYKELM